MSLLASGEQRYTKAINNNKNIDDDVVIDKHVRMIVRQELSLVMIIARCQILEATSQGI